MKLARPLNGLAPVTFLIGAGCSVSANIPTVRHIAQSEVRRLAKNFTGRTVSDPAKCLIAVAENGWLEGHKQIAKETPDQLDWGQIYDTLFADVYASPTEVSRVFKRIIREASPKINWAHLALGELARLHWISTTITTNFDLLALEGYARAGVIPVVSDGLESLDRIDPRPEHPQLLQINGSVHSYRMRNSAADLDKVAKDASAITCFRNLFQSSDVMVVVGYDGREPQIMELLTEAAKTFRDKHIFWSLHNSDPAKLSERAAEFLSYSTNARLIPGQDADLFFHGLSDELGVGPPLAFRDPLQFLEDRLAEVFSAETAELATIYAEIAQLRGKIAHLRQSESAPQVSEVPEPKPEPRKRTRSPTATAQGLIAALQKKHANGSIGFFDELATLQAEWFDRGRDKGLSRDLEVSIALAEVLIETAGSPDQLGAAYNRLGNALSTLGEREPDKARLEAAVAAYIQALTHRTRDRVPLSWAATQNNLGTALCALGARESGTARLEAAVAAYTEALKEYTRDRVPLDWAMTQNNLGAALQILGEREPGTARLEAAVAAYTEALKERTRDRVPLSWAATQNNLGNALQILGAREPGMARLKAAVAAYTEALKEWTRDRVPLNWAKSWGNQGQAMRLLADRTNDLDLASRALRQLTEAEAQMRAGEHIPFADYFARRLRDAQALVKRLTP